MSWLWSDWDALAGEFGVELRLAFNAIPYLSSSIITRSLKVIADLVL
jgi:hypothetical protein